MKDFVDKKETNEAAQAVLCDLCDLCHCEFLKITGSL